MPMAAEDVERRRLRQTADLALERVDIAHAGLGAADDCEGALLVCRAAAKAADDWVTSRRGLGAAWDEAERLVPATALHMPTS